MWSVVTDFGGLLEVVVLVTSFLAFSTQKFLYHISIIAKIYLTNDEGNFEDNMKKSQSAKVSPHNIRNRRASLSPKFKA